MHATRPLTIAHLTGESGFSGGEVQLFLLLEGLRARGDRCLLVCPPGSRAEAEAARRGFEKHVVSMSSDLALHSALRIRRVLAGAEPDLVHLHSGRANWLGGLASWSLGLPALTTRRMDREVRPGRRTRFLYERVAQRAVAISQAVAQCLREGGVAEQRIRVIASAVDPAELAPKRAREDVRRSEKLPEGSLCVLALAKLVARKGLDVLIEALARRPLRDVPLVVWLAGEGPERAVLEGRAAALGVSQRLRFLGRREDKACLLAACDLLVLPSRREGLGVAALEAMACARPVLASRVGGLGEAVVHERTGLLVPPSDPDALAAALARLAGDALLRARLGAAGPARIAEGFLASQMCEAYARLYRELLAERGAWTPPRVGIVGARRARHGLGPFVARDLVAAGAEVPCFLATSESTRDAAARALYETAGIEARGYLELETLLERESLDALAILSPPESHARFLAAAAEAGLSALCEKPLVWGAPDAAAQAARLVAGFVSRGLLLVENCQWPFALPAFEALHPGALGRPPRRFAMLLQPASRGLASLGDSLPHPISLLQALLPGAPRLRDLAFSSRHPQVPELELRFCWESGGAACDAVVRLLHGERQPRRAELELDGRHARRLVAPPDYRLSFADAGRSVPLPDPLTRLVADFVYALQSGRSTQQGAIVQRNQVLADIAAAYGSEEIA